jgi:hypothetical protein
MSQYMSLFVAQLETRLVTQFGAQYMAQFGT